MHHQRLREHTHAARCPFGRQVLEYPPVIASLHEVITRGHVWSKRDAHAVDSIDCRLSMMLL